MNADHDLLTSLQRGKGAEPSLLISGAEAVSLCSDVTCILLECHRDRSTASLFAQGVDSVALTHFAGVLARRLGPLIGGRYVPKVNDRAARDLAVQGAFTGRNHKDVMRQFGISRRLLYSILARTRRPVQG